MVIDAEKDFVAIGPLSAQIGRPVRDIESKAEELNLQPAMRVNRVPFYNGKQVQELTAAFLGSK